MMRNNKGFTLIELLVAVGIIGVLATVILVAVQGTRLRSNDARRLSDVKQVQQGLELYYSANGGYPSVAGWTDLENELKNANIGVSKIPRERIAGVAEYRYGVSADRQSYVLGATMQDTSSQFLRDDDDGSVFGVDCDDPVYCVRF